MYGTYFSFAEEDSHIHCDAEEESRKGLRIGGRLKISLGMIFFLNLCHTFYFLLREVEEDIQMRCMDDGALLYLRKVIRFLNNHWTSLATQ